MSELVIDGVPTNLVLPPGARVSRVEGDVYSICERLREHDANLRVHLLQFGDQFSYAITERSRDGKEMLVMKVPELHAGIVEECERMVRIPLKDRMAEIDRLNAKRMAEDLQAKVDAAFEAAGQQTYDAMFSGGFVMTPKPESYRPLSKAATRAGRKA